MAFSDNLLKFANLASNNIQEAFGKQSKKRRVNIRKYAQKRVKRLDSGCKGPRLPTPANLTTKSKLSARSKPVLTSQSCPEFSSLPHFVPQSTGEATRSQSTLDPSLYTDPELDSLLSDIIELESSHSSSPSASRSASVSPTPSLPTLESQMMFGEQPISPYSSSSEDFNGCSPVPPAGLPAWTSPPTTQLPYSSAGYTYSTWEEPSTSTWIPTTYSTPAITTNVCNYDPPMNRIVSELLEQYN